MVNEKMTTIADKIRGLLGISGKMGLDAMATNLETEKTNVANAFAAAKEKGGTFTDAQISGNLAAAIGTIPTGAEIKTKSGNFSASGGRATVNCGFKPDLVAITNNITYQGFAAAAGFAFTASGKTNLETAIWGSTNSFVIISIQCQQSSTGFSVNITEYEEDPAIYSGSLSYIAVKYTK
jgi:hypothetical protein